MNFSQWLLEVLIKEQIKFFPIKEEIFRKAEQFIISRFILAVEEDLFNNNNYLAYKSLILTLKSKKIEGYSTFTEKIIMDEWNAFKDNDFKEGALELIPKLIESSAQCIESNVLDLVITLVPEIEIDEVLIIEENIAELVGLGIPENIARICLYNNINFAEIIEIFIIEIMGDNEC